MKVIFDTFAYIALGAVITACMWPVKVDNTKQCYGAVRPIESERINQQGGSI